MQKGAREVAPEEVEDPGQDTQSKQKSRDLGRGGAGIPKVEGPEDQACEVTRRVYPMADEVVHEPQRPHRLTRRKSHRGRLLPLVGTGERFGNGRVGMVGRGRVCGRGGRRAGRWRQRRQRNPKHG